MVFYAPAHSLKLSQETEHRGGSASSPFLWRVPAGLATVVPAANLDFRGPPLGNTWTASLASAECSPPKLPVPADVSWRTDNEAAFGTTMGRTGLQVVTDAEATGVPAALTEIRRRRRSLKQRGLPG